MEASFNINPEKSVKVEIPDSGSIGVFISGGADSALLLYLIAKTVKEQNLSVTVHPMTGERLGQPFNLRHAQRVKEKIQSLLDFEFGLHFCYVIPNHQEGYTLQQEAQRNSHYATEFSQRFDLQKLYFAHSKALPGSNPDEVVFSIPGVSADRVARPFNELDKNDIAGIYKNLNLIGSLFPATRSCEANMHESEHFRKVCSEIPERTTPCLGCSERAQAFKAFL